MQRKGIFLALLAAALYALNIPLSKLFLSTVSSTIMAGLLYLGAGTGMLILYQIKRRFKRHKMEESLTRKDIPFVVGMILLDIAAPIFLMIGLSMTSAANASLLNNFEIVATSLIAYFFFKENISKRLSLGIILITLSCILLSLEGTSNFQFTIGSLWILLASLSWGLENNCTRQISSKDPFEIVILKGIFSGLGSIIIAFLCKQSIPNVLETCLIIVLGFISYGLSIYYYVYAQRYIGAARTSAYYAISPFISTALSLLIFHNVPDSLFLSALVFMILGAVCASKDQ